MKELKGDYMYVNEELKRAAAFLLTGDSRHLPHCFIDLEDISYRMTSEQRLNEAKKFIERQLAIEYIPPIKNDIWTLERIMDHKWYKQLPDIVKEAVESYPPTATYLLYGEDHFISNYNYWNTDNILEVKVLVRKVSNRKDYAIIQIKELGPQTSVITGEPEPIMLFRMNEEKNSDLRNYISPDPDDDDYDNNKKPKKDYNDRNRKKNEDDTMDIMKTLYGIHSADYYLND